MLVKFGRIVFQVTRIVRTNYLCEHSRECEYSGQNYYANVRANCSRE